MFFLVIIAAIFFQNCGSNAAQNSTGKNTSLPMEEYVCLPCGQSCDDTITGKSGVCNQCKMELVKKSSIVFKNILPKDLYAYLLKTGFEKTVLLDVRTEEEFNGTAPEKFGRLKNAINIPIQQLAGRINELEVYKDKEIIVYCSHSHRSPAASYLLTQKGFAKVTNLQYGMHRWQQEVTDKKINDSIYINQQ